MSLRPRLALATAAALLASTLAPGAAAAQNTPNPGQEESVAPVEVLDTDFSAGELGDWQDNGAAERISFPEVDGETILQVDRAADHHGIQSPHGILADFARPGDTVVYTADIRLGEDVEGPLEARWVGHDEGAGHEYQWGEATTVDAGSWTEVTSTFEITEDTDLNAFRAYTGLPDVEGLDSYDYYLRSASLVLIPGEEEEDDGEDDNGGSEADNGSDNGGWSLVASYDFEDGVEPWRGRGDASVEISEDAHEGDSALLTTGRTANWHGPELPLDDLENSGTYRFTAWVKLPADAEDTDDLGTSLNVPGSEDNEFPWVSGREAVGADEWVELTGEYETESGAPAEVFYVEASDADTDFLIDSVVIEHLPGEDDAENGDDEDAEVADSPETLSHDFEDGDLDAWGPRSVNEDNHTVEVTDSDAYAGDYSAAITDRTHQGQGIGADATEALAGGTQYEITAALRFAEGEEP